MGSSVLTLNRETRSLKTHHLVIGVDEAGRGPLAGPLVCGAFALTTQSGINLSAFPFSQIADSKQIQEKDREVIFDALVTIGAQASGSVKSQPTLLSTVASLAHSLESLETVASSDPAGDDAATGAVHVGTAHTFSKGPFQEQELDVLDEPPYYFSTHETSPSEIDRLNILNATMNSMTTCVLRVLLQLAAARGPCDPWRVEVLVDGNRRPPMLTTEDFVKEKWNEASKFGVTSQTEWDTLVSRVETITVETVVKGDATVFSIAAASVLAKVTRDRLVRGLAKKYPQYQLEVHKGYPTPAHKALVNKLGPSVIHRFSFEPCYSLLLQKRFPVPAGREEGFAELVKLKEVQRKRRRTNAGRPTLSAGGPTLSAGGPTLSAGDPTQPLLKVIRRHRFNE